MPLYLISYDLIKRKDYPTLWDALKQYDAHRVLESVWLINANNTPQQILDWLKGFVDDDDKLFVTEISKKTTTYRGAYAGTKAWLDANS